MPLCVKIACVDPEHVRVHLRDVETFDDIADVTAPAPVEPRDIVATAEDV